MGKKIIQTSDLTIVMQSKKNANEIFESIKNVAGWWIGDVKGNAEKIGSEFSYSYKTYHDTTQKVTELVPNRKIVWEVTKSAINFVKDKSEWKGTKMIFELVPVKNGTEIHFTHEGLNPKIECFENCSAGWDFYINKSLKNFIEKGKGIDPQF